MSTTVFMHSDRFTVENDKTGLSGGQNEASPLPEDAGPPLLDQGHRRRITKKQRQRSSLLIGGRNCFYSIERRTGDLAPG